MGECQPIILAELHLCLPSWTSSNFTLVLGHPRGSWLGGGVEMFPPSCFGHPWLRMGRDPSTAGREGTHFSQVPFLSLQSPRAQLPLPGSLSEGRQLNHLLTFALAAKFTPVAGGGFVQGQDGTTALRNNVRTQEVQWMI